MDERVFDLASFYARVRASTKERNPLRQDLVRGLKDYYEHLYGYDRYGAETILWLPYRMGQPYVYGFALLRILHDRRIATATKVHAGVVALDMVDYGSDGGLPFGLLGALHFLGQQGELSPTDLRYGLIVSAGEYNPFRGLEKLDAAAFLDWLLSNTELPLAERLFWAHSLVARHQDNPGASELVDALLGAEDIPREDRVELAQSWINSRQPRLTVEVPIAGEDTRSTFVAEHMAFWIAHSPSWPSHHMARLGLVWLARLGRDPLELAQTYITYRDSFSEQFHYAVADILAEHHERMPAVQVRSLIAQGIAISGSISVRRRFYRLGTDLFGPEYLQLATTDSASSVRQWAVKQLQK